MMRGATDLRNARLEIEEQRREIAFLQSQVDSARKEKDEVCQRLKAVKEAAQRSLQASCSSLEAMRSTMNELKSQSEASFVTFNDARSSLLDVQELRAQISISIQSIEPYLEGGEEWAKAKEMRSVINTLELECSKSQQVADLLRDRLQTVGGELIEAKSRITDLETAQSQDRAALCRANDTLARAAGEFTSLAECAKNQRIEMHDTLRIAAESEMKLAAANNRINELEILLKGKDENERALQTAHNDIARLQAIVVEKDAYITELKGGQNELSTLKSTIADKDVCIADLIARNASQEAEISKYSASLKHSNDELRALNSEMSSLRENLTAITLHEEAARMESRRLHDDKSALSEKIDEMEELLANARKEGQTQVERLQEAKIRYQALEERFEDQSVILRITREAVGDAQERLLAAETSHAKHLTEVTERFERDIAILQEQKLGLQDRITLMDAALKRHDAAVQVLQEEHAEHTKALNVAHAAYVEQQDKHAQKLSDDLAESRLRVSSLEAIASRKEDEIRDLRIQLREAQTSSPEVETELRTLRSQIALLEAADMKNTLRAKTIESRYRAGDLNEEEKSFINGLLRTSQAVHEQELVANRNELRRRDNALKEMRAKIHLLESALGRQISAMKLKPTSPLAVGSHSMIDPTAWMSSGQSSSPVQAPDRDERPSVDVTVTAEPTHPSPEADRPTSLPQKPGLEVVAAVEGTQQVKTPPREISPVQQGVTPQTAKPNFTRIATDCSDEIVSFDDEVVRVRRVSPPSSLGKRDKPSSSSRLIDTRPNHKAPKRVVGDHTLWWNRSLITS
ncbi:hypothetical protein BD414DRAFT_405053 [Trametes punicea]|nr:hypothetical protein BD414DRAFT_405053 [Trametes punicea]